MEDWRGDQEVKPERDWGSIWVSGVISTLVMVTFASDDFIHLLSSSVLVKPDGAVAFKQIESDSLVAHCYLPSNWHTEANRPAVIFFEAADSEDILFDGYSRYLAMRGAVAVVAQYRTGASHGATPRESVADGKDAIRWLRMHADDLGIDPNRIAAGGYGPDGYLAAVAGLGGTSDPEGGVSATASTPNALLLYSTGLTEPSGPWLDAGGWQAPLAMVTEDSPPTFAVQGTAGDGRHGYAVRQYCAEMHAFGNICEGVEIDQSKRSYLRFGHRGFTPFFDVLRRTDRFLASLGFLEGEPRVRHGDAQLVDAWELLEFLSDRYLSWNPDGRLPPSWQDLHRESIDPAGQG